MSQMPEDLEQYLQQIHQTMEAMRQRIDQLENAPQVIPTPQSPLAEKMDALIERLGHSSISTASSNPIPTLVTSRLSEKHLDLREFNRDLTNLDRFSS